MLSLHTIFSFSYAVVSAGVEYMRLLQTSLAVMALDRLDVTRQWWQQPRL
jgi:hypothetical protein